MREWYEKVAAGEVDADELDERLDRDDPWLSETLQEYGWICISEADEFPAFERQRTLLARQDWYAVRSSNLITVLSAGDDLPASFEVEPYGQLRLHVPRHLVGLVKPEATQRKLVESGDMETIVVPFQFPLLPEGTGRPYVRVEVLHPVLRNSLVAWFRRLAGLPAINWLLVGIFGIFQDRIRSRITRPIADWIGRRLGIRWLQDTTSEPSKPESHLTGESGTESASPQAAAFPNGLLAALYDREDDERERVA